MCHQKELFYLFTLLLPVLERMHQASKLYLEAIQTGDHSAVPKIASDWRTTGGQCEPRKPLVSSCKIVYVRKNNRCNLQNGKSWATAFSDLQKALDIVVPGTSTVIRVAQGTYLPSKVYMGNGGAYGVANPNADLSFLNTFNLVDGTRIYGGYKGWGKNKHCRRPKQYKTILDGANYFWHVVTVGNDVAMYAGSVRAKLDGVIISHGDANGPNGGDTVFQQFLYNHGYGGSIYHIFGSSLLLVDCVIEGSIARGKSPEDAPGGIGGGMFSHNSVYCMKRVVFKGNYSSYQAGALGTYHTYETVIRNSRAVNCTFRNNRTLTFGGSVITEGIFADLDTLVVFEDCSFEDNRAIEGGAVVCDALLTKFINCSFTNNVGYVTAGSVASTNIATVFAHILAGLPLPPVIPTILTGCRFKSNSAEGNLILKENMLERRFPSIDFALGGGALTCYIQGRMDVIGCTFDDNIAYNSNGGAIINGTSSFQVVPGMVIQDSEVNVSACIFNRNRSENGGAISSESSNKFGVPAPNATVLNIDRYMDSITTFNGNNAVEQGGAIYLNNTVAFLPRKASCVAYNCNEAYMGSAVYGVIGSVVNGKVLVAPLIIDNDCDNDCDAERN